MANFGLKTSVMKTLILSAFTLFLSHGAYAANPALEGIPDVGTRLAPAELTKEAYLRWAEPILTAGSIDRTSPFTDHIFAWFEAEKNKPLPPEVATDPQKIHVEVASAKAYAIQLENEGLIEKDVAAGGNVYAEIPGTVDQVLEATLALWGKPVGKTEGKTKPDATPTHSKRVNYFAPNPKWGPGASVSLETRRKGGVVEDINDRYLLLVRGDSSKGYDVLMQFIAPADDQTKTSFVLAIAQIRPLPGGKVSHKLASRYMGQSYSPMPGGRDVIGFSRSKIRTIERIFVETVAELRATGKIKDKENDL
jgi:hypothetical protein